MTQQSQLILVCEKLLGWKRGIHEEQSFSHPDKTIKSERWISPNGMAERKLPPLTLDLMWECEEKLSADKTYEYNRQLILQIGEWMPSKGAATWMWHATKEQRLAALVETIGGMK